jgi:hypothetical protein
VPLVCFAISFPALILFVEWLHIRTGDPLYRMHPWSALFANTYLWHELVSFGIGAVILVLSLALLFWLYARRRLAPVALACFAGGAVLTNYPDRAWARGVGVAALFGFVVSAFLLIALPEQEAADGEATACGH